MNLHAEQARWDTEAAHLRVTRFRFPMQRPAHEPPLWIGAVALAFVGIVAAFGCAVLP